MNLQKQETLQLSSESKARFGLNCKPEPEIPQQLFTLFCVSLFSQRKICLFLFPQFLWRPGCISFYHTLEQCLKWKKKSGVGEEDPQTDHRAFSPLGMLLVLPLALSNAVCVCRTSDTRQWSEFLQ